MEINHEYDALDGILKQVAETEKELGYVDAILECVPANAFPHVASRTLTVTEFGLWLKALRREKGLTLYDLGESIGFSNPYLSQIETGKRKNMPSPDLLKKLSEPLGVNYSDLLRLAGYKELASSAQREELEKEFTGVDFDERIGDSAISKLKEEARFIEHVSDLSTFLQFDFYSTPYLGEGGGNVSPKYNGHRLTDQDRQRVLDMLKALFPEYQQPPASTAPDKDDTSTT